MQVPQISKEILLLECLGFDFSKMIYLLPHALEESTERFPDKAAFICTGKKLDYQSLDRLSNQIAFLLINEGLKKGDRVGVLMNRTLETAQAVYGVMKAGAAYVPIDPSTPISRIKFQFENCNIKYLITTPSQKGVITRLVGIYNDLKLVIGLEEFENALSVSWTEISAMNYRKPDLNVLEQDLAYVMYTSGSTGTPKGIMHTHRSGLSYAKLSANRYALSSKDVFGNHAPIHFDISTLGYFTSPLVGGTTVIVSDAHTKMPASLSHLIEKERVSVWYSVPLALVQMIQLGALEEKNLTSLRWVLFGGERLDPKYLKRLIELWTNCSFSNVYGPAEVNQCTYYDVPSFISVDSPIPIGKVWENTEALIVDTQDNEVEQGHSGELLIRSTTMMAGYWNNSELTEASIFTRESTSGIIEKFYRTGDLMRIENGLLHFIGRKDRQVKLRGYRVELDEVANVFTRHKEVQEVAVFTYEKEKNNPSLRVELRLKEESLVRLEELKSFIGQFLPRYALPHEIHFVQGFPRTSTGKIDHKKLIAQALKE
ncbi:MAG: amino acid adenylation domain-containing protein [Flavobacteriaceae bacterium]|jgi:amino acid adenylation domain-containing protein